MVYWTDICFCFVFTLIGFVCKLMMIFMIVKGFECPRELRIFFYYCYLLFAVFFFCHVCFNENRIRYWNDSKDSWRKEHRHILFVFISNRFLFFMLRSYLLNSAYFFWGFFSRFVVIFNWRKQRNTIKATKTTKRKSSVRMHRTYTNIHTINHYKHWRHWTIAFVADLVFFFVCFIHCSMLFFIQHK